MEIIAFEKSHFSYRYWCDLFVILGKFEWTKQTFARCAFGKTSGLA